MKKSVYILSLFLTIGFESCGQVTNKKNGIKDSISDITHDSTNQIVESVEIQKNNPIKQQQKAKYKSIGEIPCPNNYYRESLDTNSFGYYLRSSPLKTSDNIVHLFNGVEKWSQEHHFAIVNMDVGKRDLQQCADAVMRLRAEYLFDCKRFSDIHFNFLKDGRPRYYTDYAGNDRTHVKFRKYMNYVFAFANTRSLKDELKPVNVQDMQVGDVFIQSGNPYGHAITVMDMAINDKGQKIFMVSQSYMPAQEIHVLINSNDLNLSPWYPLNFGETLFTPEWTFSNEDLKRFRD